MCQKEIRLLFKTNNCPIADDITEKGILTTRKGIKHTYECYFNKGKATEFKSMTDDGNHYIFHIEWNSQTMIECISKCLSTGITK